VPPDRSPPRSQQGGQHGRPSKPPFTPAEVCFLLGIAFSDVELVERGGKVSRT
jgi:hypothetical protein